VRAFLDADGILRYATLTYALAFDYHLDFGHDCRDNRHIFIQNLFQDFKSWVFCGSI
jgi:hypothetical protein